MRAILILVLTSGLAKADPRPGDEGTPEFQKAATLVKQLGDKRYSAREAAAKQLIEMGPAAFPALTAGTKSEDEEVRNRSVALLPQAKAAEWKRRAAAYLADTEGKQKHDLPLLAEWEKLLGKPDAGSRKLLAEMVKTNGEFLQTASDPKAAADACNQRCKELLAGVRSGTGQVRTEIGNIASILFVDTIFASKTKWSTRDTSTHLLLNPTTVESIETADVGPVLRRLVIRWAEVRPKSDPAAFHQFIVLGQKKTFPEAVPVVIRLAKDKSADMFGKRLPAILALGRIGGKDAAEALAELMSDSWQVFGEGQLDYIVGDAAFAASLTLHGKKLEDYGMKLVASTSFPATEGEDFVITLYGFANADARAKARQKWKDETAKK